MSYILDALKKSDHERQQRQGPILASVQQQHFFQHRPYRSWGSYVFGGLLLVIAGTAGGLFGSGYLQLSAPSPEGGAGQHIAIAKPHAEAATVPAAIKPRVEVENKAESVVRQEILQQPLREDQARTEVATDLAPPLSNIPELWQLPSSQRAGMPALNFSLHVYSSQQDQRSIIINNRMMREGERVSAELGLHSITPDGVVMKYRNEYFQVSIVDSW